MNARNLNGRLYSPKVVKDIKFVAHSSTLIRDFLYNLAAYTTTLISLINDQATKDDVRCKCQGHLQRITEPTFKIHVHFLLSMTNLLKAYSLGFQQCNTLLNEYVNLYESLKYVLGNLVINNSNQTTPATQYWFDQYFTLVTSQQYGYIQRSTRSQPNLNGVQIQQTSVRASEALLNDHQAFIRSLLYQANYYWWNHPRWWRETSVIVPSAGNLLNYLGAQLSVQFKDPLKVHEGRCSACSAVVPPDSRAKGGPRTWH